ncbi:N-6 DNA methylase [[Pasteurella] aerogenes]|nr:N-6 DNA methylase [[Pasteurella] aerogenes]
MITKDNFPALLKQLGFTEEKQIWRKTIHCYELKADFKNQMLIYPDGVKADRDTTKNFSQVENFVVFECVHNLLNSGYKPEHIILEQGMPGGHGMTGGFCDIIVQDNDKIPYLLIECKTADNDKSKEFTRAWNKMLKDGGQLFNYYNSYRQAQWLCLYASDFNENTQKHSVNYHLISMRDNEKYVDNNENLRKFSDVQDAGKEEYFKVWKDTYQFDFITHNIFESKTFEIGRRPYNIHDLKTVDSEVIRKKYHQFASIMRQHNVSARENAFDKLVNLFLCKVVDEAKNSENLNVYWHGAASDDHYSFQDRLQKLYKQGMKELLNEEVSYISEEDINDAFILFKNRKDVTKDTILGYFQELKFHSNNAFAFIDVHNKPLFLQNAVILKEVVQMLQDIRLSNEDEQHQFLGDLFEGFLDQGVKQSEGQYFTPMPIVKFLISSLPLANILKSEETPKVIDYACGAGHFLTEYAGQVKSLIGKENSEMLKQYYSHIYGIEKEYRLSKVAKVSAFMYGQGEINIIYADALAQHSNIKDGDFSVLVANPPYSVKGFLQTLSEDDKQKYSLYQNLTEENFNAIETFFIEKAKQLLKAGGVAAIVLPSSILTNGNIYIKCREILLKYFDLIAIAEFGSGTFGKTGTNTATLFLRRKKGTPDIAEHYQNRVEAWFGGNFEDEVEELFADNLLFAKYCHHMGYDVSAYTAFLKGDSSDMFNHELFQEYQKEFLSSSDAKNLQKKTAFKKLDKSEQADELQKETIDFIKQKEREKLYYFLLACDNKNEVLVVKSPADSKANKAFLGYEWSSAKGNEGIKYLGVSGGDDEENINRNQGIYQINTPLFNPNDLSDTTKINYYIRQQFMGEDAPISESHQPFVSRLRLIDMLDFSRTSFDKTLRTSVQKKVEIKSRFPLVKLGEVATIIKGVTYEKTDQVFERTKNIILPADNISLEGYLEISKEVFLNETKKLDNARRLQKNDIFMCFSSGSKKHIGKVCFISEETNFYAGGFMGILRSLDNINAKYLFNILNQENMRDIVRLSSSGSNINNLSNSIRDIKVPLPPLDIQRQIVAECEKIDKEYENSRMKIEEYRTKIAQIFHDLEMIKNPSQGEVKHFKISELCELNPSKSAIRELADDLIVSFVEMASVHNNGFIEKMEDRKLGDLKKGSYTYFANDDILIAKITPCMENGKCALAKNLTNGIGMGSSEFHIFRADREKVNNSFLFHFLNRANIRKQAEKNMTGASGHRRVPIAFYEALQIPIPPLTEQEKIVAEIESFEAKIAALEAIMQQSAGKKKAVLESFL